MKINLNHVDPVAMHLMWVMYQEGFDTRIVGGPVRDLLMGVNPKDWDLATVARPEQVIEVMTQQGYHTIPTGLQHGTVTVVVGGENYEITTLRRDVATDGRHAEVEFIDDWREDARRRDFTINAMSLDAYGNLHDYFGGLSDIEGSRVRFVGNAHDRVREDYLRILRFVRFKAKVADIKQGTVWPDVTAWANYWGTTEDSTDLAAVRENLSGLDRISGERIWAEIKKIAGYSRQQAGRPFRFMRDTGILHAVGLDGIMSREFPVVAADDITPAIYMAASYKKDEIGKFIDVLRNRFKASNDEIDPVRFAQRFNDLPRKTQNIRLLLADGHSVESIRAWIAVGDDDEQAVVEQGFPYHGTASTPKLRNARSQLFGYANTLIVPDFPVSGHDMIEMGFRGPEIGKVLQELKAEWVHDEFSATRDYLLWQARQKQMLMT